MSIFRQKLDQDIAHAEEAMKLHAWPEAAERWQAILEKYKGRSPSDVYVRLSVAYRKQAAYTEAQTVVNQGLLKFPDFLPLHIEHAEIATYHLDHPETIKRWQSIAEKFGDKVPARVWLKLSRAYRHQAELPSAEQAIRRGLRQYPDDSDLKLEAARVSAAQKDWSGAAERWLAVVDEFGEKTPLEVWAGLVKALRKSDKLDKAEVTAEAALALYPDELKLNLESAKIALAGRDWPVALRRWQNLLDKFGDRLDTTLKPRARLNISILKRLVDIKAYKHRIKQHARDQGKRSIVVYTSVSKGYDTLKPPEIIDPRFDYVVYADDPLDGMGIYDVRPFPEPNHDAARAIRYPKTHAHELFPGYDVAVWLDTSLMIVGDIYPIIEEFSQSGKAVGSCPHSVRKSVYEEAQACIELKKDDPKVIKRQMDFYKSQGFDNNDLTENGFLMFNLKHKSLGPALETWWDQITRFSKRDQLSFNYAMSKNNVEWYRLTRPPVDVRNHPAFVITVHHKQYEILDIINDQLKTKAV